MQIVLELPVTGSKSIGIEFASVLVIEDHGLIAFDLETILTNCGVRKVAIAETILNALELINGAHFDAAILDLRLAQTSTLPLALALREAGVPLVFATGFETSDANFADFRDCPIVRKPFSEADIRDGLARLRSSKRVCRDLS
jgi:DNA-binding response OmpR family regulator